MFISPGFLDHFFGHLRGQYTKQLAAAAQTFELSVVGVDLSSEKLPSRSDERNYKDLEPYYTVGCLNGPVSGLIDQLGFLKAMASTKNNPSIFSGIATDLLKETERKACLARADGFQALAITDDIAGNRGLYFSSGYFEETVWPIYREMAESIKDQGMFVFFHSDGDIRKIIELLIQAGIDCLHPVDTQAGQDLYQLKEEFGEKVCFMGHIDPITWSGERLQREITLAETEFKDGGLIMGSNCGLSMETFNEKFEMLYPQWGSLITKTLES